MAESESMNTPSTGEGRMAPFGAKTFLGGRRVSTRLRLFVLLTVLAFGSAGGVLYYADKNLKRADLQTAEAADIAIRTVKIENHIWQLRSTEKDYVLSNDSKLIGVYQSIIKSLNALLGSLESIQATKSIKKHIATVNDGLAQHAAAFKQLNKQKDKNVDNQIKILAKVVGASAEALEKQLAKTNIASLNDSFAHTRQAEAQFIASGNAAGLLAHKKHLDEFDRLLVSAPISKKDRGTIQRLMKPYQNNMTAFAKVRLSQSAQAGRLDEIFVYLIPSLNSITEFANRQILLAQQSTHKHRQLARRAAVAGTAGILILLMIFTIILIQSLATPIRGIAEVADKLVKGEFDAQLPAMGNHDEIGEVARALNIFKETLVDVIQLHRELQTSRATLNKTQQDLQDTHAKVRKTEAEAATTLATSQAELQAALRKAQQDLEQEKARKTAPPAEIPETKPLQQPEVALSPGTSMVPAHTEEPIETIAALSDQLAQSSQTASTAAFEAERTSTLIRGLNDAETQLEKIEPLVRLIGKQTNLLVSGPNTGPNTGKEAGKEAEKEDRKSDTHRNLAALSSGQDTANDKANLTDQDTQKRFETIRKAAIQVLQTVRTASRTVSQSKGAALEIAAANSASALAITTDLLEKSEHLRGMLNNLIGKLHSTSLPAPKSTPDLPQESRRESSQKSSLASAPKQLGKPLGKPLEKPLEKPRASPRPKPKIQVRQVPPKAKPTPTTKSESNPRKK